MKYILVALLTLLAARQASAESDFVFEDELQIFDGFSYDSGWQPEDSSIQVRFAIIGGGGYEATVPGEAEVSGSELWMNGTAGEGRLGMNIGIEVIASLRFDLGTPFGDVAWEGPIPFTPNFDLRFADDATFDPFLLDGAEPPNAVAEDSTSVETLFDVPLTEAIIPIPGISGGFRLDVSGDLASTFSGVSLAVADDAGASLGAIDQSAEGLDMAQAAGESMDVTYTANLNIAGELDLQPTVYLSVTLASWDLPVFSIPVDISQGDLTWEFPPQTGAPAAASGCECSSGGGGWGRGEPLIAVVPFAVLLCFLSMRVRRPRGL